MTKLYELTEEISALQDLITDGECTQEQIADTLDALNGEFEEKCINVAKVIKGIECDVAAIKQERTRLAEREKTISGRIDSLKQYLKSHMEQNDIKKIEWPMFTISIRAGSPVVNVTDESLIPDEFMKVETKVNPDKVSIKKAYKELEEGEEIPGVNVVTGESSILIK